MASARRTPAARRSSVVAMSGTLARNTGCYVIILAAGISGMT